MAVSMDQNAFRVFYEKTSGPLWGYLSRLTGQSTAADDLLQESYLRFLNARRPVMNAEQEKQYLFRIATNLVRDRWRSRHAELPLIEIESAEHLEHSTSLRSDFARAFAGLKERERQLLWLAYVEEYDHKEIAAITGLKSAGIRNLLFRARHKLATLLRAKGFAPVSRTTSNMRKTK